MTDTDYELKINKDETITYNEFKAWLTGLIVGKNGALPDLNDWKQIKSMMDKVVPDKEIVRIPSQPHQPYQPYQPYQPTPWDTVPKRDTPWDNPWNPDKIWCNDGTGSVKATFGDSVNVSDSTVADVNAFEDKLFGTYTTALPVPEYDAEALSAALLDMIAANEKK